MLKPTEETVPRSGDGRMPEPGDERPVGELVSELIDEGKAYARAEVNLYKTIATAKAKALMLPATLLLGALLFVQAGLNGLALGIVLAIAPFLGPILAGILALVLFGAIAAAMAWFAVRRIREAL